MQSSDTTTRTRPDFAQMLSRQEELEGLCVGWGKERFRERLEGARKARTESTVGGARKLLSDGVALMSTALSEWVRETEATRGARPVAYRWVKALGVDVAAYIAVRTVLDSISRRLPLPRISLEMADLMTDELRYRRLREQAPGLFAYKVSSFATSNYAHMSRSMDATLRYAEVDCSDLELTDAERARLGAQMVTLVIEGTRLVELQTERAHVEGAVQTAHYVVATEATAKWLDDRNGALEELLPVALPMVVPPLAWGPGRRGGYRYQLRNKHAVVRGVSKEQAQAIRAAPMPQVYEALNRVQETAWRVNRDVLAVVEALMERGGGVAGVPPMVDAELPPKPADIDTNEEARKAWRKEAHAVHEANHQASLERSGFLRVMRTTRLVRDDGAIWFPHNLDFRGRVYPLVDYLNPQGDDLCKGLLTFAEGKPIGTDGVAYLAVHGMNCLDTWQGRKLSKLTLQERVDLAFELTPMVESIAADPLADLRWTEADAPLQFLAWCFEWARWVALERAGCGAEYVCSLPVAMDGSCNGIQHLSAMFRDEVGGQAVNLTPNERPADIYQLLADDTLAALEREAATEPLAARWLASGLVDRSLAKRPTMTFSYGSKQYGMRDQLFSLLSEAKYRATVAAHFTGVDEAGAPRKLLGPACTYLAGIIWRALQERVVAGSAAMAWMQGCAGVIAKEGECVGWTVPGTGFPVRQEYWKLEGGQNVTTTLLGRVYKPRTYVATKEVDGRKQVNAVAPNVVHSLDAAALMLTVTAASANGVDSFAMVHDSYGTLPADAPLLAGVLRQVFASYYLSMDVPQALLSQWQEQAGDAAGDLPAMPALGTLDLSLVQASDYFFC